MADTEIKALFLQVDASVELLRRNLAAGEAPLQRLERSAERAASNVDAQLAKMGRNFPNFARLAEDASSRFERSFNDSFARVQQQAKQAITLPTVQGGGLNLGADQLRAAADAARQQAQALALIEEATIRASRGEGELTQAMRAQIAAAQAARIEAERHATDLAAEAGAAERLQIELVQLAAEGRTLAVAQGQVVRQSGAARAGFQQLSFQVGDVATQFASGTPALQIFAQQSSQVVQAISLMTTEAKGLIGFLGGPWGQIITASIVLITSLAAAHRDGADASDKHKAAADALAEAEERLAHAASNEEHQTRLGIQADIDRTESLRQREIRTRRVLQAELELAQAKVKASVNQSNQAQLGAEGGLDPGITTASIFDARVANLTAQIKEQNDKIARAEQAINVGRRQLTERAVAAATDPRTAINTRYEDRADFLRRQVDAGRISQSDFQAALLAASRTRETGLAALDKSKSGPSATTLAKRAEAAQRELLNNTLSFNDQERQARRRLIDATRQSAGSEEQRDQLLIDDINAEAAAEARKVALEQQKGKLTGAQAQQLLALNEQTRVTRLQNVTADKAQRVIGRQYDAQIDTLEQDIAILRIRADMAITAKDRAELERQVLAKEQDAERLRLERTVSTSTNPDEVASAQRRLDALPKVQTAQRAALDDQIAKQNPLRQLRDQIKQDTGDINAALDNVAANGLRSLSDSLLDIIVNSKDAGEAFKSLALSIIADLVRIAIEAAIIGPILGFLGLAGGGIGLRGGKGGYASSGATLSFAEGGIDLPGFASGLIQGPGTGTSDSILALLGGSQLIRVSNGESIMTAEATRLFGPLLAAMNAGAIPAYAEGSIAMIRGPGPGNVPGFANGAVDLVEPRFPKGLFKAGNDRPSVTFDLRGAVMTEDLLKQMQTIAAQTSGAVVREAAPQIVDAAKLSTIKDLQRKRL